MELEKAIRGIEAKRKELERAWGNPSLLSELGLKLATYNSYVGEHLGGYKHDREVMKGRRYLELLNEGNSATQADNTARAETAELKGNILSLELLHKDTSNLVSMIQSRLRVLESERSNQI